MVGGLAIVDSLIWREKTVVELYDEKVDDLS